MHIEINEQERKFLFKILPQCYKNISWRKYESRSNLHFDDKNFELYI